MRSINKFFTVIFLLLFAVSTAYAGSGKRTGTASGAQLQIPVGARGIAMSGANVAASTGVEALFWNPAGVAILNSDVDVMFSHMNYFADIGVEYGAVAANIGEFGVLAFNVKALSIGDILETTTQHPDGTGKTFSPQMLTAGISYAKSLTDNISVGLTGTFISETLGEVEASGLAFSIGINYNNLADISGLSFGLVIKNLGPEMRYEGSGLNVDATGDNLTRSPGIFKATAAGFELPSTFEIGFAYKPMLDDMSALLVTGNFVNQNFAEDEYKLGAEYGYNDMFFVRGGYALSPNLESEEYVYGFSAGAGIKYNSNGLNLRVDYAFQEMEYFDGNHVFSVTLGL